MLPKFTRVELVNLVCNLLLSPFTLIVDTTCCSGARTLKIQSVPRFWWHYGFKSHYNKQWQRNTLHCELSSSFTSKKNGKMKKIWRLDANRTVHRQTHHKLKRRHPCPDSPLCCSCWLNVLRSVTTNVRECLGFSEY